MGARVSNRRAQVCVAGEGPVSRGGDHTLEHRSTDENVFPEIPERFPDAAGKEVQEKSLAGHCSGSDYPQSETVCQELRYILFGGPWEAQGVLTVFTMRLGSPVALLGRPRFLSRNVTLFVLDCSVFKFHLMSGGSCQHPIPILFYSVSFITCSLHINA